MWNQLVLLAIAGAIGTVSRYTISAIVLKACGEQFPWGTLFVNLTGCFLFGLIWAMTEGQMASGAQTRHILLTGFMGAYTTFSTFAFDTSRMMLNSQYLLAIANGFGQVVVGILCILFGLAIGRLF